MNKTDAGTVGRPAKPGTDAGSGAAAPADIAPALLRAVLEGGQCGHARQDAPDLAAILDWMPAAVFGCDAEGRITFFNRRAVELWGREPRLNCSDERYCACRSAADADGRLLTADQLPMAIALREGASVRDLQVRVERVDGRWFFASVNIDVVRDDAGKVTGAINVFHDVSERRRAELYLIRQRDMLERMVSGATLTDVLETLAVAVEELSERNLVAAVLTLGLDGRLRFVAGRRWPALRVAQLDGVVAALDPTPCGEAVRRVKALRGSAPTDVQNDDSARHSATTLPRTEWWTPILSSEGAVVGMLGTLYPEAAVPSNAERELLELVSRSAAIAIERRQAESARQQSEARFRGIVDHAAVAVVEATADGQITMCNQRFCDLLGYTEREFLAMNLADVTHPEDLRASLLGLEQLRAGAGEFAIEKRYVHKNGSTIWALSNVSPLREAGHLERFVAMILDVTARKRSDQHAKFLDQLSQTLAPLTEPDVIMHEASRAVARYLEVPRCSFPEWQEDRRHVVVRNGWYAPGVSDTTGTYDLAQFGPEGWRRRALQGNLSVDDVEQDEDARDYLPAIRAMDVRAYASARFVRGLNSAVSLAVTSNRPRRWQPDELLLLENALARTWPLVERARAEACVRATAQRLTIAMKAGRLGDWSWDAASDSLILSGAPAEIIGVPSGSQITRADLRSRVHPDDVEPTRVIVERAMAERTDYQMEYRLRRPDGSYAWVEVHGIGVFASDQKISGAIGVMQEITSRKQAEDTLRAREAELRLISANAPAVLSHWDRNHRLLFASRAFAERWNVPPETMYGKTVIELLGEPAFQALAPNIERALAGESVAFEIEVPYRDLGMRYIQASYAPDVGPDGEVRGYLAAVLDMTERRRAELALRRSEERLRLATRTGKIGLWDWEIATNRVTWTDSLYEIHGVDPQEFPATLEALVALIHPDDRGPVQRAIRSAIDHDARYELEFRAVRPGGATVWLFTNAVVVRENHVAVRMVGATVDITARKIAELGLRESETRFRLLTQLAPAGIFLTDPQGDCIFANEALRTMAGVPVEELRGRGWQKIVHPDDRKRVATEWYECIRSRRAYVSEFRFLRPDDRVLWLQASAVETRAASGVATGHVGTVVDITERKATEDKLRAQEAQLRLISTNAPIMLAQCDRRERYLFVNRAYAMSVDSTPDQMIGQTVREALGTETYAELTPYIRRVLAGESVEFELEAKFVRGGPRFMRVCYVPDFDIHGQARGWLAAVSDLTQRREMENALRESEERFRQLADSMPQIVFAADAAGNVDYYNRRWYDLTRAAAGLAGDPSFLPILHPDDRQRWLYHWYACVASGEPFQIEYRFRFPDRDEYRWHLGRALPMQDTSGKTVRWFGTCTDIHDWKLVQDELRRRTSSLEIINRVGTTLAAEHNIDKILECATEAVREVGNAAVAAFVERTADDGTERWKVRALSSCPPAMARQIGEHITAGRCDPFLSGARTVELAELPSEPPLTLAAQDDGVSSALRSVLSVPVVSRSSHVLGRLLVIRASAGGVGEDAARTIASIASQAAIAIENASLYEALSRELKEKSDREEELRRAQLQLERHAIDLEQKVTERTKSLREAIAQMEEFSYSVSHDLRAPLRAMNAYAEALFEDYGSQLDDTAKSYLERIRRSSRRMENLTHDVLTYSRVARTDVELSEVNLETLLRDVIAQYGELPGTAEIITQTPFERIRGHEASLVQCLGNLLTNAVKFVAPGTQPRIRIWTEPLGDAVRIWVEDNGIGIPPQFQGNLFHVFERVPTREAYEGTGIGLAIVRKAAEKMGGRCGVVSDGRNGSRFWIEVPRA